MVCFRLWVKCCENRKMGKESDKNQIAELVFIKNHMPFCTNCGNRIPDAAKFCGNCGTPVKQVVAVAPVAPQSVAVASLNYHVGQEVILPFAGQSIVISPEMDAFNYYRREFRKLARAQMEALAQAYSAQVYSLDSFLVNFPAIYTQYRQPLIDAACDILMQAGIYDVSAQQFADEHTKSFCLCGEDVQNMIDSFNATIEANQERKARGYSMLPTVFFSGISGIALAFATNVAVNAIAEADIRNANVTPAQRTELYGRINPEILMQRAFFDYWRVFLTLTWMMRNRGFPMWYPTEENNIRGDGIYQNLNSGRIPPDKVGELTVVLLRTHPFSDEHLAFVERTFGRSQQTEAIFAYFGR